MEQLKNKIRDVPDFPKKGVLFKDITPLLKDVSAFQKAVDRMAEDYVKERIHYVVGVESRGFIFAAVLAYRLNAGFIPVRKKGKLPYKTREVEYSLEYGTDTVQIHVDAIRPGEKIVFVDDLLATGGTARATCDLVQKMGGEILGCSFLVELGFLKGREKLRDLPVHSLIHF